MICISVTPESRRLAKVDLLNASRQCDLIELCLDRLIKPPDMRDLLEGVEKPVLVSCRRPQEGGHWRGSDQERLALLREASFAGPAYIELEADVAKAIPLVEGTRLVVGFTSLEGPLGDIEGCFQQAAALHAEVVKFTSATSTLDDAWPLLEAVSEKRALPVVVMGLGHSGLTFSLLGRKYGSPWIYAALEKGMEVHDGQATAAELNEIFGYRDIDAETEFIGVVGFGASKRETIRLFNGALDRAGIHARLLPLEVGRFERVADMLDRLQIRAIFSNRHLGEHFLPLADHPEESARAGKNADLLLRKSDGWHAYNSLWRTAVRSLERTLRRAKKGRSLKERNVLVFGTGGLAQTILYGIRQREAGVTVTAAADIGEDDIQFCEACGASLASRTFGSQQLAQLFGVRYIPFEDIDEADADVLVIADPSLELGYGEHDLNPAFLRPSMTVMDVTRMPDDSDFITEARSHGCRIVEPEDLFTNQLAGQFQAITGVPMPR